MEVEGGEGRVQGGGRGLVGVEGELVEVEERLVGGKVKGG